MNAPFNPEAFVPVPLPVDVTDETQFPEIAEARRYYRANRERIDAEAKGEAA